MRRFFLSAFLAAGLLSLPVAAHPIHLGTLVSTGSSVNQSTTATPFSFYSTGAGQLAVFQVDIQCDAAACVYFGNGSSTTSSCTAGAVNKGITLSTSQFPPFCLVNNQTSPIFVAVISVSGTANCEVYWEPVPTVCF